jgi:LuxR family maltose regulon positive regulatory protein
MTVPASLAGEEGVPGSERTSTEASLMPAFPDVLLSTKLHPPPVFARLVARVRLLEHLQQGVDRPLTLLCAPAGFGKTTLLAQWLVQSRMSVAWLSLEPRDNDPVRFLSYLIAALQTVESAIGRTALSLLRSASPPAPETVLSLLINDLAAHAAGDVALVLDDYHTLTNAALGTALIFLLEHQPPQLHLMLATRADPALPLARLRAGACPPLPHPGVGPGHLRSL